MTAAEKESFEKEVFGLVEDYSYDPSNHYLDVLTYSRKKQ